MSKKFALIVTINYIGTPNELYGCINDGIMMRKYLLEKRNYLADNIKILRDDNFDFDKPTNLNIIKELNNLILRANMSNADEIFFHYSGHGTYIIDNNNNEEKDKKDEMICPVDLIMIRDDDIRKILSRLNNKTKLYCIMDCCHSATSLDLPYLYTSNNNKLKLLENNANNYSELLNKNIIAISGCKDNQYSADAFNVYNAITNSKPEFSILAGNKNGGALTSNFLKLISNTEIENCLPQLINTIKKNGYDQIPQLSSCKLLLKKNNKKTGKKKLKKTIKSHILNKTRKIKIYITKI